jgi:hypothetical protein
MANIKRTIAGARNPATSNTSTAQEIPAWLDRVRSRLNVLPEDPARKIFLERAFEAVIQITQALPTQALEQTAAAGNNVLVLLRALQSPEILPELERYEPLASPYLKGLQAQQELLREAGGLMTSEEAAKLLGLTRQAVDKRRQANKLIAIPQGQRAFGYPVCQFDAKGPLPGLDQVLVALGPHDGWMLLTFLLSPNGHLDGQTPADLLRRGEVSAVSRAASMFGEHGAL